MQFCPIIEPECSVLHAPLDRGLDQRLCPNKLLVRDSIRFGLDFGCARHLWHLLETKLARGRDFSQALQVFLEMLLVKNTRLSGMILTLPVPVLGFDWVLSLAWRLDHARELESLARQQALALHAFVWHLS